jgi:hypothetical protein
MTLLLGLDSPSTPMFSAGQSSQCSLVTPDKHPIGTWTSTRRTTAAFQQTSSEWAPPVSVWGESPRRPTGRLRGRFIEAASPTRAGSCGGAAKSGRSLRDVDARRRRRREWRPRAAPSARSRSHGWGPARLRIRNPRTLRSRHARSRREARRGCVA